MELVIDRPFLQHQHLFHRNAPIFRKSSVANLNPANSQALEHYWPCRSASMGDQPEGHPWFYRALGRPFLGLPPEQHLAVLNFCMDAHAVGRTLNEVTAIAKNVHSYGLF